MTSPSPGGGHPLAELSHHAVPRPLLDGQAIKPQLTAKRRGNVVCRSPRVQGQVHRPWSEVHRTGQHASEGKRNVVVDGVAAIAPPRVEFLPSCAFATEQVGPGAPDASVLDRFMDVHRDAMLRGCFHAALIMLHHPLPVVVFAARDDRADVSGFHGALTERQYVRVIEHMTSSLMQSEQMRFGEVAIQLGFLAASDIQTALARQVQLKVVRCMQWRDVEVTALAGLEISGTGTGSRSFFEWLLQEARAERDLASAR